MQTTKKHWLGVILLLLTSLMTQAETRIDLGVMQLDTDYELASFKNYIGTFTAPRSGVLTCSATTNDVMYPYLEVKDNMFDTGNAYDVTMNNLYGGRSYDFTVEAGKTYVMYARFIMNSGTTFRMTMAESQSIKLTTTTPQEGGVFKVSNSGEISFDFDKAVSYSNATISVGASTQKLTFQTSTNSIFCNAKQLIWEWLNDGTAKPGDQVTVTLSGVCMTSDKSILYNGDGMVTLHFTLGAMPITLESTDHLDGNFLSYYTTDNEQGLLHFTFSGRVDASHLGAAIRYGDVDKDPDGDYYVESLAPTLSEDGRTVTVNLQGKRRKIADMIVSDKDYGTVDVGLTGVMDEQGDYAYAPGSGSLGSYWYKMPYVELSSDVVAEFTPATGADLSMYKNIEIWITDEAKLSYDGINFAYEKDGNIQSYFIDKAAIKKEADTEDPTANILTIDIPEQLAGASNIYLSFRNLQCADGTDYSGVLHAKYNALVITRISPVAGSEVTGIAKGDYVIFATNMDDKVAGIKYSFLDKTTGKTLCSDFTTSYDTEERCWKIKNYSNDVTDFKKGHIIQYIVEAYDEARPSSNMIGSDTIVWIGAGSEDYQYTGVEEISDDEHGESDETIKHNDVVYNLSGQRIGRVGNFVTGHSERGKIMPKGIYIKNGQKLLVK